MSLRRLAIVTTTTVAGVLALGVGSASAHVGVSSTDAAPGGEGKVTFRVPDESDTASTVSLRIQLPTKTPLASVSVALGVGIQPVYSTRSVGSRMKTSHIMSGSC